MDLRDFWLPGGGGSRLSLRRLSVLLRASPVVHAWVAREKERGVSAHRRGRFDHYKALKTSQEAGSGGS